MQSSNSENKLSFKNNFFKNYLIEAPVPLALERTQECNILSKRDFTRPVLDIGIGEGLFAYILFDNKIDVGIDPQKSELERARDYNMYNEMINCYGDKIPKEDKSFKTIFSNSVMEHIRDIDPVLDEAHRLLADDGKMYLTLPTDKFDHYTVINSFLMFLGLLSLAAKYRAFFNEFWAHYHYHSVNGWKELFDRHGFEVVDTVEYCSKTVGTLNDFLVPFTLLSFFQKKFANKWFILPFLRKPFAWLYSIIFSTFARVENTSCNSGGIVFFELRKKSV